MISLTLKSGKVLEYDDENDVVYVDGVKDINKEWLPSFIPNGDDEPQFFGFVNKIKGKCYDIYGHESNVTDEDKIKL